MADPFFQMAIQQAAVLSVIIPFLSFFQYKLAGRGLEEKEIRRKVGITVLEFRFLAGFSMGWFDHIFMILGGFHPGFLPWAYWYVSVVYTAIIMCIPSNLKPKWRKSFILIWLIGIISFSTFMEINTRLILFGDFLYPVGWTPLTTFLFYVDVHVLGTFIATLHWDSRFSIVKNIKDKKK
ncbi:MAG: hypothetical protein ACTSYB_12925 [Candidatus Helarchaeota archaeon]